MTELPARGLPLDDDGVLVDSDADLAAEGRRTEASALIDRYELEDTGTVPADVVVRDLTGVRLADGVLTVAAGSVLPAGG